MNKLGFAFIVFPLILFFASNDAIAGMDSPDTNHASYWGDTCIKTEMNGDVKTYTVTDDAVTKVIVKGGTGYKVYENGNFVDLTAPLNEKNNKTYGISHVIECKDTVPVPKPIENKGSQTTGNTTGAQKNVEDAKEPIYGKGSVNELPTELPKTGGDYSVVLLAVIVIAVSFIGYKYSLSNMKKGL